MARGIVGPVFRVMAGGEVRSMVTARLFARKRLDELHEAGVGRFWGPISIVR